MSVHYPWVFSFHFVDPSRLWGPDHRLDSSHKAPAMSRSPTNIGAVAPELAPLSPARAYTRAVGSAPAKVARTARYQPKSEAPARTMTVSASIGTGRVMGTASTPHLCSRR